MELTIRNRKATVSVDSTAIITKKNGTVDLLFMQITREGEQPEADVVAGVRLNNLAELEDLQKTITEALKKHKNVEREMQ
jgi:ABC-type thiamine transport system substrate-binding protein